MYGIDLSQHNGKVDFGLLKYIGYDFVILRDGYGWGTPGRKDSMVETYYRQAKDAGMKVGFYHYIYSTSKSDMIHEAVSALSNISKCNPDLFIACDIEEKEHSEFNGHYLTQMANAFNQIIEQNGFQSCTYSYAALLKKMDLTELQGLVWVAHWDVQKPSVDRWDIWQKKVLDKRTGYLPGTFSPIDIDYMKGGNR